MVVIRLRIESPDGFRAFSFDRSGLKLVGFATKICFSNFHKKVTAGVVGKLDSVAAFH
jgi:hypothetical protein